MKPSDKEALNAQLSKYGCRVEINGLLWFDCTLRRNGVPTTPNSWRAQLPVGLLDVWCGSCDWRWEVRGYAAAAFAHANNDPAGGIMKAVGMARAVLQKEQAALGPYTPGECDTEDVVVELLRSRGAVGRNKFGVSMDRADLSLSQWVQHFQEELGDALQYGERIKRAGYLLEDAAVIIRAMAATADFREATLWLGRYKDQFGDLPTDECQTSTKP